ncbi:MAG: DoxX family protein [Pseudomonadota bacterium]
MPLLPAFARFHSRLFERTLLPLDGLPPLLLRLYLFPVFWDAGTHKLNWATGEGLGRLGVNPSVIEWFGNPDWGLGLPFPAVMAALAAYTEFFGAVLLLLGLGVRWVSLPLMITMLVAMITVHWQNGWLAIASGDGFWASERTVAAQEKLARARDLLQEHGNYDWLTETGNFVVLNNGIEFAATYFLMLLVLLFSGGGRYVSVDYWLHRRFAPRLTSTP